MTEGEIRNIVKQVLTQERLHHAENQDAVVLKTISAILTSFGIEEEDRKEIRADFIHLRKWRKSVERVETVGWTTAITVIVTGVLGALWLGFKGMVGK
jgi:hypothetical protein